MVKKLKLVNFRNFKAKTLDFSDKITVIIGPNASGKTNILESLFLLSTGKSFKARIESETIQYSSDIARIIGNTSNESSISNTHLEVVQTRGENGWPKKRLMINGVPKRLIDFAGNFRTVLFGPWDLDIVTESPSLRRRFLDTVLSQVDREYRRSILSYEKGLRQRNRVLWTMREYPTGSSGRDKLLFWNQLLIKNGDYISGKRGEFIAFVNNTNSLINTNKYKYPINTNNYQLEYNRSAISEGRLEQYKEEEISAATTLVGPHRDDFAFKVKEQESKRVKERKLATYGSRGEQRMGILWLKMAELDYIEKCSTLDSTSLTIRRSADSRPTLLLDDIFSELDHEHREVVMQISKKQQTIITTANPHFVSNLKKVERIELLR